MHGRVESQRRNQSHDLREKFRVLAGADASADPRYAIGQNLSQDRGAGLAALAPKKWHGKISTGRQEFLARVVS